jgi:hypothetical protein
MFEICQKMQVFYNHFAKAPHYQSGDVGRKWLKLPRPYVRSDLSLNHQKTMGLSAAEAYKAIA